MVGGGGVGRRAACRARSLRALARESQKALQDIDGLLHFGPEVTAKVQEVLEFCSAPTALVILGSSAAARVRLLHCLLGRTLLPDPPPTCCRWLRIQFGSNTQVQLTLGNSEFELVEELESNKKPWDTLPLQDLIRQDESDLTTMLEVELNIPLLKDGLRIIIPPDIDTKNIDSKNIDSKNIDSKNIDSKNIDTTTIRETHAELLKKRHLILKSFNTIYLYAIDRVSKDIFAEHMHMNDSNFRNDQDLKKMFDLYYMSSLVTEDVCGNECGKCNNDVGGAIERKSNCQNAAFTPENCIDLYQVKEVNPNSQVMFILLSDMVKGLPDEPTTKKTIPMYNEATESAEDNLFRTGELPESDQEMINNRVASVDAGVVGDSRRKWEKFIVFMNELLDQWEAMTNPPQKHCVKSQWAIVQDKTVLGESANHKIGELLSTTSKRDGNTERIHQSRTTLLNSVLKFGTDCFNSYLLENATKLSEVHVRVLQRLILASFELARELQIVPAKIKYVAETEQRLYTMIRETFTKGSKKQELIRILQEVLREMTQEVENMDWSVDDIPCHQDSRPQSAPPKWPSTNSIPTTPREGDHDLEASLDTSIEASEHDGDSYDGYNFEDYDIVDSNDESLSCKENSGSVRADELIDADNILVENESIHCRSLRDSLNLSCASPVNGFLSIQQASLDVQHTVLARLSHKISLKLVKFVDCLRDAYFGTLQRALESLERVCRRELGGRPASEATRRLLGVARKVRLRPADTRTLAGALLEPVARLIYSLGAGGMGGCCVLSAAWRRRAALRAVRAAAPAALARAVTAQILERVSLAHEEYQTALAALDLALADRLHHTDATKRAIRKRYAPSFARLCLESTSMCDLVMYGTPDLGREIGRGQYGVVYASRGAWAGHSPVAVKSVMPADDRHYTDLAMEFFYTRSIPSHPRIVRLLGSVVQRGAGGAPGVLLVSPRRARDLHAAVRDGLCLRARLQVACDIVEGIRYLHSLGLVHRDIKMKNVLLDGGCRAALSDLGFCAHEPLMSGSVVGTPVHMAPELLAGDYDAAVDVYAFGILFWYLCAGDVKIPSAFETFQNKEQLWSKVRRGLRPERLPHFSEECWSIMEGCWHSEPSKRALLGDVQPRLEDLLKRISTDQMEEKAQIGNDS